MKQIIICLAMFVMVGVAQAFNTTNLVPDGDFESPNGDVGPWQNMFGGDSITFLSTGGNSNGCVQISDAGSYGGIAYVDPPTVTIASLGLVAGQTYTFLMDMQIVSGTSIGGLKLESWPANGPNEISDSGNMYPLSGSTNWVTYAFTYTIAPGAVDLNVVPLWGPNSTVNYDNIAVIVPGVTPVSVAITGPTNSAVVSSNFTISASATVSPGSVTNVAFYLDSTLLGNATNSPFGFIATGISAGAHGLKAIATDSSGNRATSSVVNITVTNAPAVNFSAYESFNYTSLGSGTPTTGTGFTGNWSCGAAGTIVSGLTYPALATANSALQSSSSYQLESLANPPSGVGSVWVSFILSQSGDNGGNRDGFVLEDATGKGVMFAYQQYQGTIGEPALTTMSGYTSVGGQLSPHSQVTRTYAANNFYVLNLTYSGGALSSVSVYSNPTADQGTAPAPDFTVTSGLSGIGALSVLGVVHQAGIAITLDEIRAGTTFADVVGANLAPTIPTTLALSLTAGAQVSWSATATNYYQPQSSSDGVNWNNAGNVFYGNSQTSYFDFAPSPFYQVEQILPVAQETIINGGFEQGDGYGGAAYWEGGGSEPPTEDTADFHAGSACISLFVTNTAAGAQTCDLQQNLLNMNSVGITGGSAYQFTFWAKSLGKNPGGGYVQNYKVTWLDGNSHIVGAVGFTGFVAGSSWTEINAGSLVAPTNAVNALIEIFAATGSIANDYGGVLIDDISLLGSTPGGDISILPATVLNAAEFTAMINASGGTSAPSGTVTFSTNSMLQSSASLGSGSVTSTPAVVPASYTVVAIYSGDATYIGSTNSLVIGPGINLAPTNLVTQVSGNQLTLSWPADHTGWTLQSQTNSSSKGLSGTWYNVAGSSSTNKVIITVNPKNPAVFYRMIY